MSPAFRTCCKNALIILALVCHRAILPAQGQSSPVMFRGDAMHTGRYHSAGINNPPAVKWKFRTAGFIHASPAINKDRLYIGSGDSNFYCLNATTGNMLWKYKTGGEIQSSAAVAGSLVLFGSRDGNFYALDVRTGTLKWKFSTGGEKYFSAYGIHGREPKDSLFTDDWDFGLSSPVVENNTVYFGSGDGNLYALNIKDGTEKWKFKTPGIIHSSPAVAYGNVYFGGWDTYLHAVDASTGKELWKFQTGIDTVIHNQTGITGSPMIDNGIVFFGCRDSHVYAVNAKNGKLLWKKRNGGGWISITPVVDADKLVYTSGSSRLLVALNKITGDSVYQLPANSAIFSSPSVAGSSLYFGDMNGAMQARNTVTGALEWVFKTDGAKTDTLAILSDGVFNPEFYTAAVKKYSGKRTSMQVRLSAGAILSSPVIKDRILYFGSSDGNVYALQ